MGIKIDLECLDISGSAEVMNDAKIWNNDDTHISLKYSDVGQNAKVLNNLEIDSVREKLMQQVRFIDKNSVEYMKLEKILRVKQWNKSDFIECVSKHISEFSQGVLASIVANLLTK